MTEFRARIRSVRMKNGGAHITIVEGYARPDEDETVAGTLLRASREMVEDGTMAAFVIVGFTQEGAALFNWRHSDGCPMPRTLIPPYIAELSRRYVITSEEASERFNEMFEWVE
jgi:hypothetical protein